LTTVYTPLGMLGYGFPKHSLKAAMKEKIDVIALDAGSVDPGPYYLGSGKSFTSNEMVKRDMELILMAGQRKKVPIIIGTAGGSGGLPHLKRLEKIIKEISKKEKYKLKIATINAEQSKEVVEEALELGKIKTFEADAPISLDRIQKATRIVAQMGIQPIIKALELGADVIIAGRAYDAAVIAAFPIWKGENPGLCYHMGKILECGGMVALPRESDGMIGEVKEKSFRVSPADPNKRSEPDIVAAHTLYEKSNPFYHEFPGGSINLKDCTFETVNRRTVEVKGSKFMKSSVNTIKLEGAALTGYRNVSIAGIGDPYVIENISFIEEKVRQKIKRDLNNAELYKINFHNYGLGVINNVISDGKLPSEIGLVVEVVSNSQESANAIGGLARSAMLHMGFPGRMANSGNVGFLFTPAEFEAPECYEFTIFHLMVVDNLTDPFPIDIYEVR